MVKKRKLPPFVGLERRLSGALRGIRTSSFIKLKIAERAIKQGENVSEITRRAIDAAAHDRHFSKRAGHLIDQGVSSNGVLSVRLSSAHETLVNDLANAHRVPVSVMAELILCDFLFADAAHEAISLEAADEPDLFD